MIYRTHVAGHMEEPLTIVCKHRFEAVESDNGPGQRCSGCSLFQSDIWWSPLPIIAVDPTY